MISEKIKEYIESDNLQESSLVDELKREISEGSANSFLRQFVDKGKNGGGSYRLSSIGHCPRKQAYSAHGFPENGKKIDLRARVIFYLGDMIEAIVVTLALLAGINMKYVGANQKEVSFEGIKGHPDGIIDDKYLFECKSMSSQSFASFKKGVIERSYLFQINCYMEALGLDKCCFLAFDKNSGHFEDVIIDKSPTLVEEARTTILSLKKTDKDNLPSRPYYPDHKGIHDWHCAYCAYSLTCWPNSEYVIINKKIKLKESENEHTN